MTYNPHYTFTLRPLWSIYDNPLYSLYFSIYSRNVLQPAAVSIVGVSGLGYGRGLMLVDVGATWGSGRVHGSSSVRDQWSDDSLWAEPVEEAIVSGAWIEQHRLLNLRFIAQSWTLQYKHSVRSLISSATVCNFILSFLFFFHVARANNIRRF